MKCELKLIRRSLVDITVPVVVFLLLIGTSIGVLLTTILSSKGIQLLSDIVNISFCIMILILYVAAWVQCKRMKTDGDK